MIVLGTDTRAEDALEPLAQPGFLGALCLPNVRDVWLKNRAEEDLALNDVAKRLLDTCTDLRQGKLQFFELPAGYDLSLI